MTPRRLLGCLGMAVLMFVLVNVLGFWWFGGTLARRLDGIRAAGDPVSREDLIAQLRTSPYPGPNAAETVHEAGTIAESIEAQVSPIAQRLHDPGFWLTDSELQELSALEPQFEALEETVVRAVNQRRYVLSVEPSADFISSLLPEINLKRAITRCLSVRAQQKMQKRQYDDAFETLLKSLAITGHYDQEPFLVGHLVSIACRGMALSDMNGLLRETNLNEEQRERLDAELTRHDTWEPYRRVVKQERVYQIESVKDSFPYFRPVRDDAIHQCLDEVERELALIGKSIKECEASGSPAPVRGIWRMPGKHIAAQVLPAHQAARNATARSIARIRCLRILNALQAIEAKGGGPIDDCRRLNLPAGAIVDPFSGDALRIRHSPDGVTVYSVGPNLVDDGGRFELEAGYDDVTVAPEPVAAGSSE